MFLTVLVRGMSCMGKLHSLDRCDCRMLTQYAGHFNILIAPRRASQSKNTTRQQQNIMNIMSDAKISQQDLYLLYVDLSSVFNTIDHDKLLCTMHDLGFPEDAIEVIADCTPMP